MGAKERNQVIELIRRIGKADAFEIFSGKVVKVNEGNLTIDVQADDDVTITEVRLKATIDNSTNGCYVIPKNGSHVKIALLDGGVEFSLLQASEIDKYIIKIGNQTLVIDKDAHVFDGGNNKGMVKAPQAVERWNKLEADVNLLKQLITAWTPAPGDGGTALKTALAAWAGQQLQTTNLQMIENPKVKH